MAHAHYLGPKHAGIPLSIDPANPLPFGKRADGLTAEAHACEFQLAQELNELAGVEYPDDERLRARIKAYELAFRMQTAVPEAMAFPTEPEYIRKLYGLDQEHSKVAGERSSPHADWSSEACASPSSIPVPSARGIRTRS
jgi:hypothetical protein